MRFRLIPFENGEADWNMAVDEYLFRKFLKGESLPVLRFYGFEPPAVTLGFHQKRVPKPLASYPAVNRPTGGRAVLHDGDLVYSVVASYEDGYFAGTIYDTYRKISELIVEAMREFGLDAELSQGAPKRHSDLCFDSTTKYEITIRGKKVVGAAQVRRKTAFLEQGSIQLFVVPREALADAIRRSFERIAGVRFEVEPLSDRERQEIEVLRGLFPVIRPSRR